MSRRTTFSSAAAIGALLLAGAALPGAAVANGSVPPVSFAPLSPVPGVQFDYESEAVQVGDLDNDGDVDLLAYDVSLLQTDSGAFTSVDMRVLEIPSRTATLADLNNDDVLDAVGTELFVNETFSVAFGIGDGHFTPPRVYTIPLFPDPVSGYPTKLNVGGLAVGDFDGDEDQDLVFAPVNSTGYRTVFVGTNDGSGVFSLAADSDGPLDEVITVNAGDFDEDGHLDRVLTNASGQAAVQLGNGDGTFTSTQPISLPTASFFGAPPAVADFNGDGRDDIAVSSLSAPQVFVALSNPDGSLGAVQSLPVVSPRAKVRAADLNGDGATDLVVINQSDTVSVLLGNGDGTFQNRIDYPTGANSYPVSGAIADLDGDTRPDIVVSGNFGLGVLRNATPSPVTVTASSGQSSVGQTPGPIGFTATGFRPGDTAADLTTQPTCTTTATASSAPGEYPVTCTGAEGTEYAFSYVAGTWTVVPPAYTFGGVQQPINADGSSVFKAGSTIPVKFGLTDNGAATCVPTARLSYAKVSNGIAGDEAEAVTNVAATSGNLFRCVDGVYQYNWSTKGVSKGTYLIKITVDGAVYSVQVSLK